MKLQKTFSYLNEEIQKFKFDMPSFMIYNEVNIIPPGGREVCDEIFIYIYNYCLNYFFYKE